MAKKNLSIQLDEVLLKQTRHLAVEEDVSLSEWVNNWIAQTVKARSGRAASKEKALAVLFSPLKLGDHTFIRDDLYQR